MMRRSVYTLAATLCALFGLAAAYSQTPPAAASVEKAERAAVVQAAAKALRDGYVFPDVGEQAAKAIESALTAGTYDTLSEPPAFAERLTADLQAVAHDKHLRVFPPGGMAPAPGAAPPPRSEGGVTRADRLAGDVGYIEIVGLPPLDVFRPPLDRAMAALAKTKGLIIDARRNGGGGPEAEAYLASYFLPKGAAPVAVNRFIQRNPGTNTFRTQDFLSSPTPLTYTGKRVYVLTSSATFSGGEAVAYDLRALGLCKIVGETTGGGGHPGGIMPLGAGFALFLPGGRGENPTTRGDWEGVGVKPDVAVPAADALKVALEQLGQKPSAADVEALSHARLFTPRTTPQPGSEAAVRRMIEDLRAGEPNYTLLAEGTAQLMRSGLAALHDLYTKLGAIESVTFVEVDLGGNSVYDVKLANGSVRVAIVLTADGKTALAGARLTSPPPQ
jgi:hypothetical protein